MGNNAESALPGAPNYEIVEESRDFSSMREDEGIPSEPRPRWTFITVTYNSREAIEHFWYEPLPSGIEWIVVDNNSEDETVRVVTKKGAKALSLDRNLGFGAANNIGLSQAQGHYILFVNPDVAVDYASLPELEAAIDNEERRLVGPRLLSTDGAPQFNGRGFPYLTAKISNRLFPKKNYQNYRFDTSTTSNIYVPWLVGAAIAGSRQDIVELGGWDERYFLYYEDHDICLRAWQIGMSVVLVSGGHWVHGWARETAHFRLSPWKRELASMVKFYVQYPEFLFPFRSPRQSLNLASTRRGKDARNKTSGGASANKDG